MQFPPLRIGPTHSRYGSRIWRWSVLAAVVGWLIPLSVTLAADAATSETISSDSAPESLGRVVSVNGTVLLLLPGQRDDQGVELVRGANIPQRSTVASIGDASARLLMKDGSVLVVGPTSRISFNRYEVAPTARQVSLTVTIGKLWARVTKAFDGETRDYEIKSPNAVAGVRGTDLVVDAGDGKGNTKVTCFTGSVEVKSSLTGDSVLMSPGNSSTVGSEGRIVTVTLTASQMRDMRAAGAARASLDSSRAKERAQQAQAASNSSSGNNTQQTTGTDEQGENPDEGSDNTTDDIQNNTLDSGASGGLNLEPGDGPTTRVRGRIEVRHR